MSTPKEVRFNSSHRRRQLPVQLTSTPRSIFKKSDQNSSLSRSLLNNYRLERLDESRPKPLNISSIRNNTFKGTPISKRRVNDDENERTVDFEYSSEDDEEEGEDEDDEEYDCDCSTISEESSTEEADTDEVYNEADELRRSLASLDDNRSKIIYGRDLLSVFHTFAKWFNNLKDGFGGNSSSSRSFSRSSYSQTTNKLPSRLPSPRMHSTRRVGKNQTVKGYYNDPSEITGDVTRDAQLTLLYPPSTMTTTTTTQTSKSTAWNDSIATKYYKYEQLMARKCNFADPLTIWPGIGREYAERLSRHKIADVGTMLELYMSVDESTFKCLMHSYAHISQFYLNLIYATCKAYIRRHGFEFNDVTIRSTRR